MIPVTVTVTQSCDTEKVIEITIYWSYKKHIYFRLG